MMRMTRRLVLIGLPAAMMVLAVAVWLMWLWTMASIEARPMEQFKRQTKDGNLLIEVGDAVPAPNRWDEYREVRLRLQDGQRLTAAFFRDPMQRGGHWCEEAGMVIVQDLTTEDVMAAVDDIIQRGAVRDAFLPMDE